MHEKEPHQFHNAGSSSPKRMSDNAPVDESLYTPPNNTPRRRFSAFTTPTARIFNSSGSSSSSSSPKKLKEFIVNLWRDSGLGSHLSSRKSSLQPTGEEEEKELNL